MAQRKNLIVTRNLNYFPDATKQNAYLAKVSVENLKAIQKESKLPVINQMSVQYSVYFGSDENLVKLGNKFSQNEIEFEIK